MSTFEQQPSDVTDYDVDLSAWFKSIPGDNIESVVLTVSSASEDPPTLILGPEPHPTHVLLGANPVRFKVWAGGGTAFTDYKITCLVLTSQDRRKETEFKIKVRDR